MLGQQRLPRTRVPRADGPTGYRRVAAELRQRILDGETPPGSWLRLQAVADSLGVSVQPVREALQLLEGEGLLEILPNRGARVHGLDRRRLTHIFETLAALESYTARRFAEDATLRELRGLQTVQAQHDAAVAASDLPAVSIANKEFHGVVNGRGENLLIGDLIARYIDLSRTLLDRIGVATGYLGRAKHQHHAMLTAFRRRDASAAADLGAAHVRHAQDMLLARLQTGWGR